MRKSLAVLCAALFPLLVSAGEIESTLLLYQAREPGVPPYTSRILVSERFVRMDDGEDASDYLIFDRQSRLISSVTHEEETVFEIPPREVAIEPPLAIERRSEKVAQPEAPRVAGKAPQLQRLYVNDALCYSVVTIPLLEDTVDAIAAFRQVLAGEHAKALPHIPADMQDSCDLALNTFHPRWQMSFGLPLQEWDEKGNGQVLMDFNPTLMVDEKLFELPEGYKHYDTDEL
ncbi:MAG: hypothetical protein ACQETD_12620 [Pseudomonadota bacterium]